MLRATACLLAAHVLAALAGGCGANEDTSGDSATALKPGLPIVEGLERDTRSLDREALAAEAIQPEPLLAVLDEAGFRAGLEDAYSGRSAGYAHVVSRRLEFSHGNGAARYVDWLRNHAADLLGTTKPADSLNIGAGGFLTRDTGCDCQSDLPTFLAAWRDGASVRTLLADGPGVDRVRFVALARELG